MLKKTFILNGNNGIDHMLRNFPETDFFDFIKSKSGRLRPLHIVYHRCSRERLCKTRNILGSRQQAKSTPAPQQKKNGQRSG
ncbi:hypothetical protein D3C78_871080 [compost metagenome]